jgi:hypothetical protein
MWTNKSITILGLTKQSDSSGWGEGVPTSWSRTCSWRGRPGCRTPPSCTAPCSAAPSPRLPPPSAATTAAAAAAAGRTEQFNTASRSEFSEIRDGPTRAVPVLAASSEGRRFREDSQHLGRVGSLLWLPAGPYSARARGGPEWPVLVLAASPSTRLDVSTARSCPPRTQRGEQSPDEDAEIFPAGDGAALGAIPSDSWR